MLSPFKAEIVALIEGRYAAEKDAEVMGEGGGGSRRSDGREVGILKTSVTGYRFKDSGSAKAVLFVLQISEYGRRWRIRGRGWDFEQY